MHERISINNIKLEPNAIRMKLFFRIDGNQALWSNLARVK